MVLFIAAYFSAISKAGGSYIALASNWKYLFGVYLTYHFLIDKYICKGSITNDIGIIKLLATNKKKMFYKSSSLLKSSEYSINK